MLTQLGTSLNVSSVLSCFVCGQVSEQGQGAYLWMTGVMSLLPLAMIGGVVLWIVLRIMRASKIDTQEEANTVEKKECAVLLTTHTEPLPRTGLEDLS